MELSSSDKPAIFNDRHSPELFAGFAAAGLWLRLIGSCGMAAAAFLLFQGFTSRFVQPIPWVVGGIATAYTSVQLIFAGMKAATAKRNNDLAALSASGRHIRNAARILGIAGILMVTAAILFIIWLVFFGRFSR